MKQDPIISDNRAARAEIVDADQDTPAEGAPERCPECGGPTSGDGPFGPLCPQCLIGIALDDDADVDGADGSSREIAPYRIVRMLGEGGMGIVYLAEQEEPVHRQVAVKVLRPGLDSKMILARFEAERQALAMMDHPNIAKVLDARQTRTGRPYFVMELVEGEPITRYCDRHRLPVRERLELFATVCRAVQHAHHKGVIHRDLKPSNILVTTVDGRPVPKVIDFGLAKAIEVPLTEMTLFTRKGELMGTPEYMSPEQADMDGRDLDTRTDVYSLGVVLHELLVGVPPFESTKLRQAGHAEIIRILREEEPRRPSTRVSSPGLEPATAAARREADLNSLARKLRGDLDWIVVKALAKDPDRRYPTPNALATDVDRYLGHEPVEAGPPSTWYRFGKFARRNRVTLTILVAVAFGLLAAAGGLSFALVESNRQRAVIESALGEAERARGEAEAVVGFLEEMLAAVDPAEQGRDVTVREVLDEASSSIETEFESRPLVEARLRATIGGTYKALGVRDAAEVHLTRAEAVRRQVLGKADPLTLESMSDLGGLLMLEGRLDDAVAILEEAMALSRGVVGARDAVVLNIAGNLGTTYAKQGRYDEAAPLLEEALQGARATRGDEDRMTLALINSLASLYETQGRFDEAEAMRLEALRTSRRVNGDEHPDTMVLLGNLAVLYMNLSRYEQAEPLFDEALRINRKILGDEHPSTLSDMNSLAVLYMHQGRYDESEVMLEDVLRIRQRVLGHESLETLITLNNLAGLYSQRGRPAEAASLVQEALPAVRRALGDEHVHTASLLSNLGAFLLDQGRYDEAGMVFEDALRAMRVAVGDEHPATMTTMNMIGVVHLSLGRYGEAERSFRQVAEARERILGDEHLSTLMSANNLGITLFYMGRHEEAEPIFDRLAEVTARVLGEDHPETLTNHNNRARLYKATGRYDEAERRYEAALEGRRRVLGDEHPKTIEVIGALGDLHSLQGRPEDGERLLAQALEVAERTLDPRHPTRLELQRMRALSQSREERYPEAETILLGLYDALSDEPGVERAKTARAIADLYVAWGRAEKAAVWRERADARRL